MNILLIPNNDWINHPVPAQRHYRIFEELGKRHNVYVLQFDLFAKSGKATHVPKFTKIVHPFTVPVSNPAQFYLANLPFQTRKIFSTLKKLDIDLVFGSNLAVCSLGFAAAKSLNVKTIFDLSDYFPESASAYFSEGSTALSSVVKYVSTFFTNFNIKLADICTTCSFTLRDYVKKISSDSRVEHLPNGVDLTNFKPKSSNERLRREFGLKENILVYVGSIESWMDFEMVLDALSILKLDGIEIQLLIVGRSIYSNEENPLVRSIRSRGLDEQVKFLGFKPYETVPDFINLGVAGLLPFKPNLLLTQMAFPNKLLEYLACGKPVFAPPMRELRKVGGENLLEYDTPTVLAAQIRSILKRTYDPERVRQSVLSYDWVAIARKLENLMLQLLVFR